MLSQTESWAEDSDDSSSSSAGEGGGGGGGREDAFLGGGRVSHRPPRLCRIVSSAKVRPYEEALLGAVQSRRLGSCCDIGDGGGGGGDWGALGGDWVHVSRCRVTGTPTPKMTFQHDSRGNMWVLVYVIVYLPYAEERQ